MEEKEAMRKIDKLIIHCTATPEGRETSVEEITKWHKARKFRTIGYHYVVHLDGRISRGRQVEEIGAHCKGQNHNSIGVCYVGGVDVYGKKPKDTRTKEQKHALKMIAEQFKDKYPEGTIHGHYEFVNKACPSFKIEEL
jgi:N-acetylmuramoyl-L-alanine amidase